MSSRHPESRSGAPPGPAPHQHDVPAELTRNDRRWDISAWRDWIILLVMVLVYVAFAVTIYLFEPGIR